MDNTVTHVVWVKTYSGASTPIVTLTRVTVTGQLIFTIYAVTYTVTDLNTRILSDPKCLTYILPVLLCIELMPEVVGKTKLKLFSIRWSGENAGGGVQRQVSRKPTQGM